MNYDERNRIVKAHQRKLRAAKTKANKILKASGWPDRRVRASEVESYLDAVQRVLVVSTIALTAFSQEVGYPDNWHEYRNARIDAGNILDDDFPRWL